MQQEEIPPRHEHSQHDSRCPSFPMQIKQIQQFQFDFQVSPEKTERVRWELAMRKVS